MLLLPAEWALALWKCSPPLTRVGHFQKCSICYATLKTSKTMGHSSLATQDPESSKTSRSSWQREKPGWGAMGSQPRCTISYALLRLYGEGQHSLNHPMLPLHTLQIADAMDVLSSSERNDLQHTCNGLQNEDPSWEQLPSRVSPVKQGLQISQKIFLYVLYSSFLFRNHHECFSQRSIIAEPYGKDGEHQSFVMEREEDAFACLSSDRYHNCSLLFVGHKSDTANVAIRGSYITLMNIHA